MPFESAARPTDDGPVMTMPISRVNLQAVLERFTRLGVDAQSEAVRTEAAELLAVIRAVPEGREQEIACRSFGTSQSYERKEKDLHPWAIPGAVAFWIAVWGAGMLVFVRWRRRTVRGIEDRKPRVERF